MVPARVFGACSRVLMAAAKGAASARATTAKTVSPKNRPNIGIQKVVPVSSQLGNFLGTSEASRTGATKKIWEHIKLHNLQNPTNKREILCDDKLKIIFEGKDRVWFTEIAKLLSNHFAKSA